MLIHVPKSSAVAMRCTYSKWAMPALVLAISVMLGMIATSSAEADDGLEDFDIHAAVQLGYHVLLLFEADSCDKCDMYADALQRVADALEEQSNIVFGILNVDVDYGMNYAQDFNVQNIPSFVYFGPADVGEAYAEYGNLPDNQFAVTYVNYLNSNYDSLDEEQIVNYLISELTPKVTNAAALGADANEIDNGFEDLDVENDLELADEDEDDDPASTPEEVDDANDPNQEFAYESSSEARGAASDVANELLEDPLPSEEEDTSGHHSDDAPAPANQDDANMKSRKIRIMFLPDRIRAVLQEGTKHAVVLFHDSAWGTKSVNGLTLLDEFKRLVVRLAQTKYDELYFISIDVAKFPSTPILYGVNDIPSIAVMHRRPSGSGGGYTQLHVEISDLAAMSDGILAAIDGHGEDDHGKHIDYRKIPHLYGFDEQILSWQQNLGKKIVDVSRIFQEVEEIGFDVLKRQPTVQEVASTTGISLQQYTKLEKMSKRFRAAVASSLSERPIHHTDDAF